MSVDVVEDELGAHVDHALSGHEQIGGSTALRLELTERAPVASSPDHGLKWIDEELTEPPEYVVPRGPRREWLVAAEPPDREHPRSEVGRFEIAIARHGAS